MHDQNFFCCLFFHLLSHYQKVYARAELLQRQQPKTGPHLKLTFYLIPEFKQISRRRLSMYHHTTSNNWAQLYPVDHRADNAERIGSHCAASENLKLLPLS